MCKFTFTVNDKVFPISEDYCEDVAREDAAKQAFNYFNNG